MDVIDSNGASTIDPAKAGRLKLCSELPPTLFSPRNRGPRESQIPLVLAARELISSMKSGKWYFPGPICCSCSRNNWSHTFIVNVSHSILAGKTVHCFHLVPNSVNKMKVLNTYLLMSPRFHHEVEALYHVSLTLAPEQSFQNFVFEVWNLLHCFIVFGH